MAAAVHAKGRDWLNGDEAASFIGDFAADANAAKAVVDYFAGWQSQPMSLHDVAEYFVLGYLNAGTAEGNALRNDLASAIIRCYLGDHALPGSDRIVKARQIRADHPSAFWFMVALARKHSSLCQQVLKAEFNADEIPLQRGVRDSSRHYAIESWAYAGSVGSYGEITLRAKVPLTSVLSLRAQEHEIVVLRHPWESEILVETQAPDVENEVPATARWRVQLADHLEVLAKRLRGEDLP